MKVAYLLDVFPVISETFITREIVELNKSELKVEILSIKRRKGHISGNIIHEDSRSLIPGVIFLDNIESNTSKFKFVVSHALFFVKHPVRYLKTVKLALQGNEKDRRHFVRAVMCATLITRMGIQHIHAHFALNGCTRAMFVSSLTDVPYSFTIHAHDIFLPSDSNLQEINFLQAKFVACISNYNKIYISKKFRSVNPEKLKIIHCAIDPLSFEYTEKDKVHGQRRIVAIGRLVEQKGYKYLIEACNSLRAIRGNDFQCSILGEGKARQELEALIKSHNLESIVSLEGAVGQDQVKDTLKSADLFVLPCVIEASGTMDGIPVALMEAMALGVPVVSTSISGIPELINDKTGILVNPEDVKCLALAIDSFFNLPQERITQLKRNAREKIETDFNIETETKTLSDLFY